MYFYLHAPVVCIYRKVQVNVYFDVPICIVLHVQYNPLMKFQGVFPACYKIKK